MEGRGTKNAITAFFKLRQLPMLLSCPLNQFDLILCCIECVPIESFIASSFIEEFAQILL